MKEKEKEEKVFTCEFTCFNEYNSCYNNLILEKRKYTEKEDNIDFE